MAKRSKNINMFLMDGEVTGKIKCTLSNWTGVIYKIPRIQLGDLKSRDEMKQSGIYFLFGRDEDKQKDVTYIGQATTRKNGEGVLLRIQEHTRDIHADYFNDVIILTTQNNSFGPTEISYLENKFTQLAKEAGRYIVKNGNDPNPGNVTEEKESELDEIVENTLMIIGTLGYRVFVPMTKKVSQDLTDNHSTYLYLKRKTKKSNKVIEATCERTTEGFVVLEGSQVEIKDSPYLPASLKEMRQNLIASRVIQDGVLKEKQLFSSPSYAAAFLLGMQTNGRTDWKNQDGRTLKELEELID
ncbi:MULTISPECIES: GIY-YIG nuclease family protein [unclassified Streptococcus]|uniref:GIY-YIG nuclease family protein n=1 Tax=unclassified Streptococcus TaxID=2608887 RepID=UPI0020C84FC4|nr:MULTISPECIES: GIY-YIG nuclease family protein [unclassified Streptococcus]MCP9061122.1 GIY-YIG nuclease family protein [Streptococcus sp. CF7_Ac1-12]MCP9085616.1 GIY-YIG nuclease family protein [Streptococcus sp. CF7_Ac1-8]